MIRPANNQSQTESENHSFHGRTVLKKLLTGIESIESKGMILLDLVFICYLPRMMP